MTLPRDPDTVASPPRRRATVVLVAFLVLATAGFSSLGVWQLFRLQWKLDLIARVDSRVHASPLPAPAPAEWPRVSRDRDEYRHVRLEGQYLTGHDTRVQALTDLGAGDWILTPFRTVDGAIVLVNRGFVPSGQEGEAPPPLTTVTGLLRLSEPRGSFLRANDPAHDRWFSRDVAAIARDRGLGPVAPYFVDLDAPPPVLTHAAVPGDSATLGGHSDPWPRAGLTVVQFRNNHLGYALTWFALALMSAGAAAHVVRDARGRRNPGTRPTDGADPRDTR